MGGVLKSISTSFCCGVNVNYCYCVPCSCRSATVLDNMFMMMERYSGRLEEVVSALEDEKRKTDALLYKMLPKLVLQAKNGCDIAAFSL